MKLFAFVRRGQEITRELWNDARAFVLANQLRAGKNIRLHRSPDGVTISADTGGEPWDHPFRVVLSGKTRANITPGFVNLIEARVDGVPLSGDGQNPPPVLEWTRLKTDTEGRGYIVVEVECDERWQIKPEGVKLLQVGYFDSENGEEPPKEAGAHSAAGGVPSLPGRRARWPIAMLRERKDGRLDLFQNTQGDLQFRAQPRNAEAEIARCFFV